MDEPQQTNAGTPSPRGQQNLLYALVQVKETYALAVLAMSFLRTLTALSKAYRPGPAMRGRGSSGTGAATVRASVSACCWASVEHQPTRGDPVAKWINITRPGGVLVATAPERTSRMRTPPNTSPEPSTSQPRRVHCVARRAHTAVPQQQECCGGASSQSTVTR